jgi:hypothetical protein
VRKEKTRNPDNQKVSSLNFCPSSYQIPEIYIVTLRYYRQHDVEKVSQLSKAREKLDHQEVQSHLDDSQVSNAFCKNE